MESKIYSFNGEQITFFIPCIEDKVNLRDILFTSDDNEKLVINSLSKRLKCNKLILDSSIENISNFLKENNLDTMKLWDIAPLIDSEFTSKLILVSQIIYNHEALYVIIGISSEKWNKLFSIKEFKKYVESKIKETEESIFTLSSKILLEDIDKKLALKEIIEEHLNKINSLMLEFEQENLPEKKLEFKVHEKFKTGIKQYIVYFNEYVKRTKGKL